MSDDLKSKLQLDASQVIAEAGKVEAALKKAEKAGNSTTGGMASGLKAASAEVDKHNATVGKMVDKYRQLEGARKFFDKQPAALRDIDKQQVSILKNLERQAKSEQELTKYMDARYKLQEKMQKSSEQYSAHSQRQFGQLQGVGMVVGGALMRNLAQFGGAVYGQTTGAFNQLNQKYQLNPELYGAQLGLRQAQLNVGSSLAGYEQYKTNLQAAFLRNPNAGNLAMAGDIAGVGLGAAGGLTQLMGALKTAGAGKGVMGSLGVLGSIGGGVALGSLLAQGISGGKAANPLDAAMYLFAPGMLGSEAAQKYMSSAAWQNKSGKEKQDEVTYRSQRAGVLQDYLDAKSDYYSKNNFFGGKTESDDPAAKARFEKAKSRASDAGWNVGDVGSMSNEQIQAQIQADKDIVDVQKENAKLLKNFLSGPIFGLQIQRMQNQRSDFQQDLGIQQNVAARQFSRGKQDLSRQRQYADEDYAVTLQKIQVNRVRAAEDYGMQLQKIDLQQFRTKRDLAIQETRFNQDQARQKRILDQDFTKEQTRRNEDYARQTSRNTEDYQIQTYRVNQDYQIKTSRLVEDTTRDKLRADQDYSRSSVELSRNAARSMQDLNRNYHDSLLSILAPGLANSKMMQLFRLRRDYNTQAGRIGEDTQFAQQGLQLGYGRQQEDISRGLSRGMEDANRERDRAQADLDREKKRAEEDLAREKARAEADAVVNKARAEEQMSIEAVRQAEDLRKAATDAATDADLARRDASIAYTRAMQDAARDEADAARQHKRALEENDIALTRLTEDYKTQTDEFAKALARFNRDWDLTVKETAQNLSKEFGVAATDIETALKGSLDGITGANAESIVAIQNAQKTALTMIGNAAAQVLGGKKKSAAFGEWDTGQGGPYQLHPGEMVVPKPIADALRSLPGGPGGSGSNYAPQPGMASGASGGAYAPGSSFQITIAPGAVTVGGGTMTPAQVQQTLEKHLNNFRNEIQQTTGKQINFASSAGF